MIFASIIGGTQLRTGCGHRQQARLGSLACYAAISEYVTCVKVLAMDNATCIGAGEVWGRDGGLRFICMIEWHLKSGTSSASHPMARI